MVGRNRVARKHETNREMVLLSYSTEHSRTYQMRNKWMCVTTTKKLCRRPSKAQKYLLRFAPQPYITHATRRTTAAKITKKSTKHPYPPVSARAFARFERLQINVCYAHLLQFNTPTPCATRESQKKKKLGWLSTSPPRPRIIHFCKSVTKFFSRDAPGAVQVLHAHATA